MVARKPDFKYPKTELYVPARRNDLHVKRDNRVTTRPTDLFNVAVAVDKDTLEKQVLLIFPKAGVHYAVRTVSELQRIRDGIDDILDQTRRPRVEEL